MCGRVTSTTNPERLAEILGATIESPSMFRPRYNVAPDSALFALTIVEDRRLLVSLRWGLASGVGPIINARSESVEEKPTFRPMLAQRCVVPVDGYFEWEAVPGPRGGRGRRLPHYVTARPGSRLDHEGLLLVAALWRERGGEREGVLLTRDASAEVRHVHDRMPLVLDSAELEAWLSGRPATEIIDGALAHPDVPVHAHRVDVAVNDARREGASLIEPIEPETLF